jgi:hypothetical protein
VLHVLELRQQHRLRLSCGTDTAASLETTGRVTARDTRLTPSTYRA